MSLQTYTLNIGPTHPAFKEPVQFKFEIDGEIVVKTDIEFGYTHRGIESVARSRNFIEVIYLLERVCGICSVSHPMAYCMAVEQAAGIEVPGRAQYIRTIIGELERLHSHLLWAGVAAHEIGFDTLFMYTWNVREDVLDLLELVTGNRVNYAMLTIGGVRRDITEELVPVIREVLDHYRSLYNRMSEIMLHDESVRMRCEDVGVLTYEDALRFCAVGPTARASGLNKDVRVDYPMNAYPDMEWLRPVSPRDLGREPHGDVYDRVIVRVLEIQQSIEIIEYCLDHMPEGPIAEETNSVKIINKLKKMQGEGMGRYEAPRGEVSHYDILDNREGPAQLKVKAPTYSNMQTWVTMLEGAEIADIPIVVASIDPCIACADRMTFTKGNGKIVTLTSADLHKMSIEKMNEVRRKCNR
ncbi:MAG: NADH dehydrogenase subunit [Spirochaetae bacterium HGW-Spirochaetae-1]|jgi:membrane-bound hydrogenase subunit alpha|nr:MAG: NADH dehydrogenase subunit [Spirochaetae bacterium HGW-Spirochaetae-1]